MKNTSSPGRFLPSKFAPRRLALALAACSFVGTSLAGPTLPTGLQVMQGQASVATAGNKLTVTNSNGAILNWSSFSIGAQNTVNFVQPSSASQVLNRVTGNDPSQILGNLTSNGKVWLLNPNGVLFGQGATVNVASLVTSTLNLNDQDWLAGRYAFSANPLAPAAGITNQGTIRAASGGQVLLLASGDVRNEGVIEAQGGQIALAAGASVELIDTATPRLSVKVTAPQGQAVNLGTLSAAGGRIDVQAASVNQQGIVRADSLGVGPAGEIVMNANGGRLTLAAGSVTSANGQQAGGQVELLGSQINLADGSTVSANGALGGGTVLVGGGAQGLDASVPNSDAVYFAPGASIAADATQNGDGGHIVLWSNTATRAYGSLSATGGAQGGNGGLIETSGHWLDANPASLNVRAPKGRSGTWLLDPIDLTIDDTPGDNFVDFTAGVYSPNAEGSHVYTGNIAAALNLGTNVTVTTSTAMSSSDLGDITGSGTILVTATNPGSLTLTADHDINYSGSIISQNGPLTLKLQSGKGGIGGIVLTNSTFQSDGGDITLGGFQNNGILPNGSTFTGAANGATGTGIVVDNTTLDATGAALNIYGYGNSGGVLIQNTSNLRSRDLTIYGYSLAGTGVEVNGSNAGSDHTVNVQGNGSGRGIYIFNSGNFYVNPATSGTGNSLILTALGHSPAEALIIDNTGVPGVALRVTGDATLTVSAENQGGGLPALSIIGNSPTTLMIDGGSSTGNMQFSATGGNNKLLMGNLEITGSSGSLVFNSGGNLSVSDANISMAGGAVAFLAGQTGQGGITLTNSSISTSGGQILLGGFANGVTPDGGSFGGAASSSSGNAVYVSGATLNAGSTPGSAGTVTLSGTSSGVNGVYVLGGSQITGGNISINGSATGFGQTGVAIESSTLTSPGSITVQGASANQIGLSVTGSSQITDSPPVSGGGTLSLMGRSNSLAYGVDIELSGGGQIVAGNGTAMSIRGGNATPAGQAPVAVLVMGPLDASSGGVLSISSYSNGDTIALNDASITGSSQGVSIYGPGTLNISNTQITTSGSITVMADNVALNAGTMLTSNRSSGDNIVIQGNTGAMASFTNAAGAGALSVSGGPARWILWDADITDSSAFQPGGLAYGFTYYGADIGSGPSYWTGIAGNGFVSAATGFAFVNGNITPKVYDATTTAQVQGTLTVNGPQGLLTGFDSNSVQFADKNAGNGKTMVVATPAPGTVLDSNNKPVYGLEAVSNLTGNILQFGITLSGGTIQDKTYDGTTSASFSTPYTANFFAGDGVALTTPVATFSDKNVGNGKFVGVEGLGLTGEDAANYTIQLTVNTTGNITPATLLVNGLTVNTKIYDATTAATFIGTGSVSAIGSDQVTLSGGSAQFVDKNVGTGKAVTLSGFGLTGPDAGNYVLSAPASLTADILPATLYVSGLAANNKVYDATTAATLSGSASVTALGSDQVTLSGGSAQFADKNVGSNKTVMLSGFGLSGADAGNYILNTPESVTANITPATLVVGGLSVGNKVYDATTAAKLSGNGSIAVLGEDQVSLSSGSAEFGDKNVGSNKTVTLTGFGLSGADAGNYVLIAPSSLTADITPATLVVSGLSANNKVYDATTAATLSGGGSVSALGSDQVSLSGGSARFSDKNVGNNKAVLLTGFGLSGADAGNYVLSAPASLTADITPATLTVSGLAASNKVYDATTLATLSGAGNVAALGTDQVSLTGGTAQFSDKNVGSGKTVTLSGYGLSGADAGNYVLSAPASLTADITPATLNISGLAANNKVYDATTAATISGTAHVAALGNDVVSVAGILVGSFADKNAGTDKAVTLSGASLSGADAGNYVLGAPPGLTASITPATLTYVADAANKLISAAVPPLSGSVSGFVGGETQATATSGTLSFSTPATAASPAGSYAINGDGLAAQNYQFVQADSNATALTVAGFAPVAQAPGIVQAGTTAVNTSIAATSAATVASPGAATGGGLLNMLQAPGAGPASASAVASASAISAAGTATAQSFGPTSLSSLSMEGLSAMLASRDRYKQALFADATAKLEDDPSMADAKVCTTLKAADTGTCIVTDALRRESRARQQLQQQASLAHAPEAQLDHAPPGAGAHVSVAPAEAAPAALQVIKLPARRRVKEAALPQIERKVAVVIGVDAYQDKSIPSLGNAVNDAEAVGRLFEDKLGYETVVIPNASKAAVISALNRLALATGPKDSIVIYYAGHGDVVEATKEGYWLLSDADAKKPESWLSNADIGRLIAQIDASQVALISDSCYSGSLVSNQHIGASNAAVIDPTQLLAQKSVVVMSSGGNEPVFDTGKQGHSPFSWNLMNQLGQVSNWQPGGNVFARVRFAVARELPQRPQYGAFSLGGQPAGEYLFEQRQLDGLPQ